MYAVYTFYEQVLKSPRYIQAATIGGKDISLQRMGFAEYERGRVPATVEEFSKRYDRLIYGKYTTRFDGVIWYACLPAQEVGLVEFLNRLGEKYDPFLLKQPISLQQILYKGLGTLGAEGDPNNIWFDLQNVTCVALHEQDLKDFLALCLEDSGLTSV